MKQFGVYFHFLFTNVIRHCCTFSVASGEWSTRIFPRVKHAFPGHPDVWSTFRAASQELNLLKNDSHCDKTIAKAKISASPYQIRILHRIRVSSINPNLEANQVLLLIEEM